MTTPQIPTPKMAKHASRQPKTRFSAQNIVLMAGTTILLTFVLVALSSLSGGFASDSEPAAATGRMSLPIMIHLFTVIPAIPMGAYILWRKKGDRLHKYMGRIWAALMVITSITTYWIGRPGSGIAGTGFSFIHIFAVITLVSIPYAIWQIRLGNVRAHYQAMQGPYIGLLIAGLLAFIPGRVMGNLVFG